MTDKAVTGTPEPRAPRGGGGGGGQVEVVELMCRPAKACLAEGLRCDVV